MLSSKMYVNVEEFNILLKKERLNPSQFAVRLGLSRSFVFRVLKRERPATSRFIASFKKEFPRCSQEKFFALGVA